MALPALSTTAPATAPTATSAPAVWSDSHRATEVSRPSESGEAAEREERRVGSLPADGDGKLFAASGPPSAARHLVKVEEQRVDGNVRAVRPANRTLQEVGGARLCRARASGPGRPRAGTRRRRGERVATPRQQRRQLRRRPPTSRLVGGGDDDGGGGDRRRAAVRHRHGRVFEPVVRSFVGGARRASRLPTSRRLRAPPPPPSMAAAATASSSRAAGTFCVSVARGDDVRIVGRRRLLQLLGAEMASQLREAVSSEGRGRADLTSRVGVPVAPAARERLRQGGGGRAADGDGESFGGVVEEHQPVCSTWGR